MNNLFNPNAIRVSIGMQAKITSVYDEGAVEETSLIGAEGFSILIEADGQKILFDTGKRGRYLTHNMMCLDIEADDIDKVVISHGHSDHVGGLDDLIKERESVLEIFAPASAMGTKKLFGASGVYVPEEFSDKAKIITIEDWTELSEHVHISPPTDTGDGKTESFILLSARKGPVVISACSHCGVDRIMDMVKEKTGSYPRAYIGGVHIGKKDKAKAAEIASFFTNRNCTERYLNHCTGVNGIMYLRTELGLKEVNDFYVGESVDFEL